MKLDLKILHSLVLIVAVLLTIYILVAFLLGLGGCGVDPCSVMEAGKCNEISQFGCMIAGPAYVISYLKYKILLTAVVWVFWAVLSIKVKR